jgi:hypothetical protein
VNLTGIETQCSREFDPKRNPAPALCIGLARTRLLSAKLPFPLNLRAVDTPVGLSIVFIALASPG